MLVLHCIPALAQENKYTYVLDTNKVTSKVYIPTGFRVGVDLLGPALHIFDDRTLSLEFTGELDFDKYSVMAEAGYQNFEEQNDNVYYHMSGSFIRIGPDANFLYRDNLLNSFTFGLRYARANFTETVYGNVSEPTWGDVPVAFNTENKAWWLEMNTGIKVRLYKGFFIGYIFRFRFLMQSTVPDVPFEPYYVPGYGRADFNTSWGFRYYVFYRFQWAKKAIRPKPAN